MDDVQDGNVAVVDAFVAIGRDHHVLGLEEATHHVEHGRLAHLGLLFLVGERRVGRRQEVKSRRRNESRYQTDQIVVHVARIAEWRCAR